jgi:hypothetical protein
MARYTQREWDRVVGYGTVPEEYIMHNRKSSEDWMIERVLLNELSRMEVLQNSLYTDQDVIVRKWLQKRIDDLTQEE